LRGIWDYSIILEIKGIKRIESYKSIIPPLGFGGFSGDYSPCLHWKAAAFLCFAVLYSEGGWTKLGIVPVMEKQRVGHFLIILDRLGKELTSMNVSNFDPNLDARLVFNYFYNMEDSKGYMLRDNAAGYTMVQLTWEDLATRMEQSGEDRSLAKILFTVKGQATMNTLVIGLDVTFIQCAVKLPVYIETAHAWRRSEL
ncbi:hypothetical protein ACJX0J_023785, partial [Zea mays]